MSSIDTHIALLKHREERYRIALFDSAHNPLLVTAVCSVAPPKPEVLEQLKQPGTPAARQSIMLAGGLGNADFERAKHSLLAAFQLLADELGYPIHITCEWKGAREPL